MPDTKHKSSDLLEGLAQALNSGALALRLEGAHRINADPLDPSRATATMPDGTKVHGTLDERGNFTPDITIQGEPNAQSDG